jgi:hypothetical protein
METRHLPAFKAVELQSALAMAKAGQLKTDERFHNIEAHGDALLVEPVNGDTFVFEAPATVHVFASIQGSGTDKLRKRIDARLFVERLATSRA